MKQKMFYLLMLTFYFFYGFGQNIPMYIAKKIAINHYCQFQSHNNTTALQNISFSNELAVVDGMDTMYYVFNVSGNRGFEVISACYQMRPVLAFSSEGRFDLTDQSPALVEVMNRYKASIKEIRSSQANSSFNNWDEYLSDLSSNAKLGVKNVSALLTTKWAQNCYYNSFCPTDVAGPCSHAVTGCVAVAMCQIMKYHNYPAIGIGSVSYTNAPYGVLTANFSSAAYNWGNMPDSLTGQNNDVARLLYHFGVAVKAHYTANSTCATTVESEKALFSYFKYSRSAITIKKSIYDDATWVALIRNELDSLRPVFYSYGAHAVVVDGYNGTDYFHINYGWGGSSNGYYYLNDLYNYNGDQAIIYIKPATTNFFNDMGATIAGVKWARSACGDYDNDGDLDILFSGYNSSSSEIMKIYRNNNGNFVDANITLPDLGGNIDVNWGDYDNDGDLDILTSMYGCVLKNNGGVFVTQYLNASVSGSGVDWGDYDNDGYLDAIISGHYMNTVDTFFLFRNNISSFQNIPIDAVGLYDGTSKWADFDNDGDLDIFTNGRDWTCTSYSNLYLNNGSDFTNSNVSFIPYYNSRSSIFDYDKDGDFDIFMVGNTNTFTNLSSLYNNDNMNFSRTFQIFKEASYSDTGFGDFDNDGDMDLVYSGQNDSYVASQYYSYLYLNRNDGFHLRDAGLPDLALSTIAVGDFENDGDMDVFIAGMDSSDAVYSKIFRNNLGSNTYSANAAPSVPSGLSSVAAGNAATLSWNKSTDDKTNQNSLTYNIRIGTAPGGVDVVSPMSNVATGYRRIPKYGNTQLSNSWAIKNLQNGTYYWSVQAIDNCYKPSAFAGEHSFTITGANIELNSAQNSIMIYPNPSTNGHFYIEGSNIIEIDVINIYGQSINKIINYEGKNKFEFNINMRGIYMVKVLSKENTILKKLLVE